MRSVMSTVKRAAGYEEENQQAEQIANEMFQVTLRNLGSMNKAIDSNITVERKSWITFLHQVPPG